MFCHKLYYQDNDHECIRSKMVTKMMITNVLSKIPLPIFGRLITGSVHRAHDHIHDLQRLQDSRDYAFSNFMSSTSIQTVQWRYRLQNYVVHHGGTGHNAACFHGQSHVFSWFYLWRHQVATPHPPCGS